MKFMRVIGLFWIVMGLHTTCVFAQKLAGTLEISSKVQPGYTLFATVETKNTYLIDNCGNVVNRWQSQQATGNTAYLMNTGNLVRALKLPNAAISRGGGGGGIEVMDWNSNLLWSYTYNTSLVRQHHDALPLANGNILVLAWQVRSRDEAIAAGRNPALILDGVIWSEEITEVKPVFPNGFEIVWKWNLWDHLIQDFDPTKSNYGVVSEHPELVDLNLGDGRDDWVHLNALGYNPDLDQIMVCTPIFNELLIIDHSTTTAQAATHAGGKSNKGGDILYRWGNPQNYKKGTVADKVLGGGHNAHWIDKDLPSAGKIIVFNNTSGTAPNHSSVELITPPLNSNGTYDLQNGRYGPATASVTYKANPSQNLYSANMSGAEMQPNGNILICSSQQGRLIELTSTLDTAWLYKSPITLTGIAGKDFNPTDANFKSDPSFRAIKYPPNHPALAGRNLVAGDAIEGPKVECNVVTGVPSPGEIRVRIYPNPVSNYLYVESTDPLEYLDVRLIDLQGRQVAREHGCGAVRINTTHLPDGVYITRLNNKATKIIKQGERD